MSWDISIQTLHLNLGDYGLITSLNVPYWLSLGLLFASFALLLIFRREVRWLLAAQTIFLVVVLYLTPFLIENTPRQVTGFTHYSDADYVINHGHLNAQILVYHNWPGYSLIVSQLAIVTKMDSPLLMMSLFPFIIKLAGLLPLYLLFRQITLNNYFVISAAVWVYNLGFWVNQDYASPQAIALFLMILACALFAFLDRQVAQTGNRIGYTVALVLVFTAVVLTHALTSIAVLAIAVVLFLMKRLPAIQLGLLLFMIFLAWSLYGAATEFKSLLPVFWSEAFRLDRIFSLNLTEGFAGTATRKAVSWARVIFTAVVGLLALCGFIGTLAKKKWEKSDTLTLGLAIGAIAVLPISYGYELFHRLYIFAMAPVSQFGGKLAGQGKMALGVVLVALMVFIPVHILTRYGSEQVAHTRAPELAFQDFFFGKTLSGHVIGGGNYVTYKRPELYSQTINLEFRWDPKKQAIDWTGVAVAEGTARYLCFTVYDMLAYSRFSEIPDLVNKMTQYAEKSPRYDLVYVNQDVTLYSYTAN